MKCRIILVTACILLSLAGCNSKPKNEPVPQPPQIIQDQKQALDKAKATSEALEKQSDTQKKQIEEATK